MHSKLWRQILGALIASAAMAVRAANDGELWEVTSQQAAGDGPLGAATTHKICFPKNKDFKEPPEKDSPNCKTDFQRSGKKTTFKSVCKDADGTITSSGVGEELGPNHYRNDVTITEEMRGQPRTLHRQVGVMKRIGTGCDPNSMFKGLRGPQGVAPNYDQTAPSVSGQTTSQPTINASSTSTSSGNSEPDPVEPKDAIAKESPEKKSTGNASSGPVIDSALEAGKSLLKGLLKF